MRSLYVKPREGHYGHLPAAVCCVLAGGQLLRVGVLEIKSERLWAL